jgi:hypothetical protein
MLVAGSAIDYLRRDKIATKKTPKETPGKLPELTMERLIGDECELSAEDLQWCADVGISPDELIDTDIGWMIGDESAEDFWDHEDYD